MSLLCPTTHAARLGIRAATQVRRHGCIIVAQRCSSSSSSSSGGSRPAQRSRTPAQLLTLFGALGALAVVLGTPSKQQQQQQHRETSPAASSKPLDADTFNTYPLRSTSKCTSPSQPHHAGDGQHVHLDVALPPSVSQSTTDSDTLAIHTLYMAHPDIQVQRPYTPLYAAPLRHTGTGASAQFLIKRYKSGEVGRYAHALRAGDEVWLRGPEQSWVAKGGEEDLLLIAGGTGITPMYQLITTLLGPPSLPGAPISSPASTSRPIPKLTLLYAAPTPSSLLLLPELEALRKAHPELDVRLWVERDSEGASSRRWSLFTRQREVRGMPLRVGRLAASDVKAVKRTGQDVLLCGPDAMVAALAGPKARDGRGQGALRGVLLQLGYSPDRVHKL